ncbi:MAG: hypothetical protein ACRYGF_00350 [Janthinobacterium lividum]
MTSEPLPPDLGIADRLTRSEGRTARDQNANARLTKDELEQLKRAAKKQGQALGEWTRDVLLKEARQGQTERAIFTELMALRLLLNGVLRPLALGETLSKEKYQALVAEVRNSKHETARDVLTQYEPPQTGGQ